MILILEQDNRPYDGMRWRWKPYIFRAPWGKGRTWRVVWGFWSLSYYPAPGLYEFFETVRSRHTRWIDE